MKDRIAITPLPLSDEVKCLERAKLDSVVDTCIGKIKVVKRNGYRKIGCKGCIFNAKDIICTVSCGINSDRFVFVKYIKV